MLSSPRPLAACRATQPTFWLSPATCSAQGGRYLVTGRTVPRYHIRLRRDHLRHPWRCGEARTPPHPRTHRARPGRRQGEGRQIRPQADADTTPAERGPQTPRNGRDAAQRRAQLQCQPEYDFTPATIIVRPSTHVRVNPNSTTSRRPPIRGCRSDRRSVTFL